MAAVHCGSGHLARAARQPCRPHTAFTITSRPVSTATSLRPRDSIAQDDAERPRTAHTVPHTAFVKRVLPGSGFTAAAAAAAALLTPTLPGAALAAEQPAQESVLPQLPSPPEIVQSLSQTLLGDSPSDSPSAEAPPLKDDDSASGKPSENGNGKDAAKNGNGDGKSKGVSAEDAIKDQELETRFKSQILPKIQEQLKGLDQNEKPNAATIELKRQLRRAEDDIYRLLEDLKHNKSDAARAEATGLAREFEDIRQYVKQNGGELADEAGG